MREQAAGLGRSKLPIVEPGKKPSRGVRRMSARQAQRLGEVGIDGQHVEIGEALLQTRVRASVSAALLMSIGT